MALHAGGGMEAHGAGMGADMGVDMAAIDERFKQSLGSGSIAVATPHGTTDLTGKTKVRILCVIISGSRFGKVDVGAGFRQAVRLPTSQPFGQHGSAAVQSIPIKA
jgi:hypothetical protein